MKNKTKLIMMTGIPGSGKSTYASEYVAKHNNTIRVNKDLLRTMLHFDKWNYVNENVTALAETALIRECLSNKLNVIVDNTNLLPRHMELYRTIANDADSEFIIKKMDTSYAECVERDKHREKKVGQAVVLKYALQTKLYPAPSRGFVICDIDGTIADISHRLHFVKQETKDWRGFFSTMDKDAVRKDTLEKLAEYQRQGYEILFVSARPDDYRTVTEAWLEQHVRHAGVEYVGLLMRNAGDRREDTVVKYNIWQNYLSNYSIHVVIDDRPSILRMWQSLNLAVVDVGAGIEF